MAERYFLKLHLACLLPSVLRILGGSLFESFEILTSSLVVQVVIDAGDCLAAAAREHNFLHADSACATSANKYALRRSSL